MRKAWAVLAAALLAAAFFLPATLSQWGDRRLLDEPHITRQEEEREGFAESLQLSVAEKLLLLRSGNAASVTLEDYMDPPATLPGPERERAPAMIHAGGRISAKDGAVYFSTDAGVAADADVVYEAEEAATKWNSRLARVQGELRGLQSLGAMPYLWSTGDPVECTGYTQTLYIDQESQVSFLAYNMYLSCPPYNLNVMADGKTGRILAFRLSWEKGAAPDWGFRGAANFGTAWRDYWGMDSVSSAWNSEYIRSILETPEEELTRSGSYNCNADIAFGYDGQTLRVPLVNWVYSTMKGVLEWNLM